jgi:hypothetical protein
MPTPSRLPVVHAQLRVRVSERLAPGSANPSEQTSPLPSRSPAGPSAQRAAPAAATRRPRQRGRPPGKPLSAAELAARRANLRRARAADKDLIYRPTARRRAASRANIQRAIAWRRSAEGNAVARLNALQHGLYAQRLEDSLRQLGDDPKEFARHRRLLEAVFVPADDVERKVLRRLAELTWRRLRLFHAQARWEADRLHGLFAAAPRAATLTPLETERRALALVQVLNDWTALLREASKLESGVERRLRALVRKRSGGQLDFHVLCPRREAPVTEPELPSIGEFLDRLELLSPEARVKQRGPSADV